MHELDLLVRRQPQVAEQQVLVGAQGVAGTGQEPLRHPLDVHAVASLAESAAAATIVVQQPPDEAAAELLD